MTRCKEVGTPYLEEGAHVQRPRVGGRVGGLGAWSPESEAHGWVRGDG